MTELDQHHGAEAEELRKGIEKLIEEHVHSELGIADDLQSLFDRVCSRCWPRPSLLDRDPRRAQTSLIAEVREALGMPPETP